ncbi:MAG TPA: molybdate ABC transporter substrate-binding protein [Acidimicrobiia bacterium]
MRKHLRLIGALTVVIALFVTATAEPALARANTAAAKTKTAKLSGSITVSAAASLTEAFTQMGKDFQKKNKGANITFNFAASSALAAQIQGGAPADVFASADGGNLQKVVTTGQVTAAPTDFTANLLTIVVKPGNPKGVKSLADLAKVGVVSLCAAAVPCGKYATQMLTQDGVTIPTDKITLGQDVKATLTAVATGDADAGLVYATDAKSAGKTVAQIKIPASLNILAIYPIAPIAASQNTALAKAWVDYVLSPVGQKTLAKFGFLPVPVT